MAHIKFKSSSNAHDYREFSLLRARLKHEFKKCLRIYVERIESLLISNPSDYRKFIKNNSSLCMIPKGVPIMDQTLVMSGKQPIYFLCTSLLFSLMIVLILILPH